MALGSWIIYKLEMPLKSQSGRWACSVSVAFNDQATSRPRCGMCKYSSHRVSERPQNGDVDLAGGTVQGTALYTAIELLHWFSGGQRED